MKTSEFKTITKTEKNINVYSVNKIFKKGNIGYKIIYSEQFNETTVSTEKEKEFWNMSIEEIATQFFLNDLYETSTR